MIRKLVASSIAAVTTLGAMPVLAQSTAGIEAIEEIEVISRSRRSEGLADLNAAVSVIGAEELSRVAQMHYQQALNRLPGVNIHRNNGQESLAAIRSPVFTGAGACGAFLVAENGIPVRSHGFCNVNEMFDTHSESADRIEVVRGPGSAFWGSNAVHGLINVVLPEPGEAKSLRLEKGPRGTYRGNARLGSENGNFKQLFLVNGVNEKGYQEESGFDQQKLSWLYNYDAGGGTEIDGGFTLINLNQETAGYIVGTDVYKDGDLRKRNPNPEAYRDSKNHRVWTTISHQNENWEFVFTPYWREVNMNFIQHFLPGQPVEDFQHTTLGFQGAGYRTLDNGAVLAIGMDLEDTSAQLLQYQPNPTQGSFFLRNSIPQGRHYDFEVEARQLAAFVNYEQSFASGWELSLGLRLEDVDYEYDNLMIDGRTNEFGVPCRFGCRYNRPSDRADSFTNLSPKLGLSYTLSDYANLQLRVQRGFRAPQATEL
ncbi:MAG TPA: TonB-dependent receptor, partial [Gammaproteobacteria bacterium]|nr:TonB-dependent receptor [Gammaproteobacteria bacterium]